MGFRHAPVQTMAPQEVTIRTDTRLPRHQLVFARVVWGVLVAFALGMFAVSLPGYIEQPQTHCLGESCSSGQLSPEAVTTLHHLGLSVGEYIAFNVGLLLVSTLVACVIAFLLVLRRSDDWMALVVSFALVEFSPSSITNAFVLNRWIGPTLASILTSTSDQLSLTSLVLMFYLFPDGRFVPRWTRWLVCVGIGFSLLLIIYPNTPDWLNALLGVLYFVVLVSLVIAQIYRYRRVSSLSQRQQTKWVVYSLAVTILLVIGNFLLTQVVIPALSQAGSLSASIDTSIGNLLLLPIPIAFGIAILRYRLYDIDVIINRTLVYGVLTISLALVYFGLVIGLQSLVRLITGQIAQSPIVIVASTLAIAALFQPLRHRIQAVIDRRFYRRKYDAARTLAAFSATLRGELDLNQLSEHLVQVVEETMQPAHVSLWLRKAEHERKSRSSRE
jgi:hypothetical protein